MNNKYMFKALESLGVNQEEPIKTSNRVFLGGTCNGTDWRDVLIPKLVTDYFNPVVKDWNEEAVKKEQEEKENCNVYLFVITPRMTGAYSIHEITFLTLTKTDKKVIFYLMNEVYIEEGSYIKDQLPQQFTEGQYKSFKQITEDLKKYSNFVNLFDFDSPPKSYEEAISKLAEHINNI